MESENLRRTALSGIFFHNPALLPPEELKRLFLVRHAELERVLDRLTGEGSSAHPILILGDRGLGKTTLLIRIAHAVEERPELRERWWPVRLDEEQYNVGSLADFWLNCLEKIAESTDDAHLRQTIDQLLDKYQGEELEEAAFLQLREYSIQKGRHLLLLVDNLDSLLDRLDRDREPRRLRELLQEQQFLTLIGAAQGPVLESFDYDSPFYEFFEPIILEPLGEKECLALLRNLGDHVGKARTFEKLVGEREDILRVLYILTGGNLRTTALLFAVLQEHPAADLATLLDHLFDQHTNLYKESIESLSPQGQRVFDALARAWAPATADEIASELRIERGVASGQLHRLVERHFAAKVQLPQRSMGFQIRDRFFNLWYLMRGGRRQRQLLYSLVEFIGLFYRDGRPPDEFERLVSRLERMELATREEVDQARREAVSVEESNTSGQIPLFPPHRQVPPRAQLLTLCCSRRLDEAFKLVNKLLEMKKDMVFLRVVHAYLLEEKDQWEEALAVTGSATEAPPWLRLEQARLRIRLGKVEGIEELFVPASQFEELPARELAMTIAELARKGGEAVVWAEQPLLMNLKKRASEELTVPLAGCQLELVLGRDAPALENFREALRLGRQAHSPEQRGFLLHMALHLAAAGLSGELLKCLEEAGIHGEWLPLTHALAFLGDDPKRLEKLAPEMRALTRIVVERIENLRAENSP